MQAKKIHAVLAATVLAMPFCAQAASDLNTGTGTPITASAAVDFQIRIPKIIFLQVGTGSLPALADVATVDLIDFNVSAAGLGTGPTGVTVTGGDLTSGVVTARLIGNNGDITFNVTTGGALGNGAGDSISYTQISTTATALAGVPLLLSAPVLADGASSNVTVTAASKIVNRGARWTYAYANAATVPPGTYGGVNTNNSRAVYSASMP